MHVGVSAHVYTYICVCVRLTDTTLAGNGVGNNMTKTTLTTTQWRRINDSDGGDDGADGSDCQSRNPAAAQLKATRAQTHIYIFLHTIIHKYVHIYCICVSLTRLVAALSAARWRVEVRCVCVYTFKRKALLSLLCVGCLAFCLCHYAHVCLYINVC